jgi:hypothetical protein
MICPNKECGEKLQDNYAAFCDMCGRDIFRCVNPECSACGVLTIIDKCCPQCGEPVEPNGPPESESSPAVTTHTPQQTPAVQAPPPQAHATEFMAAPGSRLIFRHSDNWQIELVDGDILGRVNGRFTDHLGSAKFVSGTHAIITRGEDGWYIADQGSRNKTWVNGKEVPPNTPLRIKQNDIVTLADQKFIITEL